MRNWEWRRIAVMGAVLAGAALTAAVCNAAVATSAPSGQDLVRALSVQTQPDGAAIYLEQCAPCHGPAGEGGVGPALAELLQPDNERILSITQGGQGMPAFGSTLTGIEITFVSEYIDFLAGEALYGEQCASCHGSRGEGDIGPSLVASDLSAEEERSTIVEGRDRMPAFGPALTELQIDALVQYIRQLGEAEQGPILYAQQCAPCHGAAGEGGIGPALGADLGSEAMTAIVVEGRGSMPAFGSTLTSDEIAAVVEFSQGLGPEEPQPPPDEPVTVSGVDVYARHCAACHGADGEGGIGPRLQGMGLAADAIARIVSAGQGSMPGFADALGSDEIGAVADYVHSVGDDGGAAATTTVPEVSGAEMFTVNCAQCHAPDGSGGLGPSIRNTRLSLNEIISVIYGGHAGGMPAFEGELTGLEVQRVARFVETLAGDGETADGGMGWAVWLIAPGSLLALGLLVGGALAVRRSRRRERSSG